MTKNIFEKVVLHMILYISFLSTVWDSNINHPIIFFYEPPNSFQKKGKKVI